MKAWYSAQELAGLPGMPGTTQNVTARARRDAWESRPRQGRGGGREYALTALPPETRAHLAAQAPAEPDPQFEAGRVEGRKLALTAALDERAAQAAKAAGLSAYARLSPRRRAYADARAWVVEALGAFAARGKLPWQRAILAFVPLYNTGGLEVPGEVRASFRTVSRPTLYRWRARYEAGGLGALAGQEHWHLEHAVIDDRPDLRQVVLGMLADHPHASAKAIHRAIQAKRLTPPTLRAVQRWVKRWRAEQAQLALRVANPDAWRSRYQAAAGDAAAGIERLNQLWELDSTPGDVLLNDGARHAIIGCIDLYSRRLKLHVARTSRSTAIAAALRRALLAWGVPERARTDEGADYTSLHIRRVLDALGIAHERCPPFTPDAKPFIERALGTFSHSLVELAAGYIGHSVADRKAIESRKSFAERLMGRGETLELRMSPAELQQLCDAWCEDLYGREPHSGLGGRSPWDVARAWTGPVARVPDERALDVLLAPAADGGTRVIGKKGVRVGSTWYSCPEMGGREGETVEVRVDDTDLGRIYLFSLKGGFVGIGEAPELSGINPVQAAKARKTRQREVLKAGLAELKAAAKAAGTRDILADILAERGEAAAKVTALPAPSRPYLTEALEAAAAAVAAREALAHPREPEPVSEESRARVVEMMRHAERPPETPDERFRRALTLEGMPRADLTEEQRRWLDWYRTSSEYTGRRLVYDDLGPWWAEAQ